jgi:hypothetical protein
MGEALLEGLADHLYGKETDTGLYDKETYRLCLACCFREHGIAKALLESGAKVNPSSKGKISPLLLACKRRDTKMVLLLLRYGADINYKGTLGNLGADSKGVRYKYDNPIQAALYDVQHSKAKKNLVKLLPILIRKGARMPSIVPCYLRLNIRRELVPVANRRYEAFLFGLHRRLGSESPVALLIGDPFLVKFIIQSALPGWLLAPSIRPALL